MSILAAVNPYSIHRVDAAVPEQSEPLVLRSARNAYASCQLLLRPVNETYLSDLSAALPDGVGVTFYRQETKTFADGEYPDPLAPWAPGMLPAGRTAVIWADFRIEAAARPGVYPVTLRARTVAGEQTAAVRLEIAEAVLPDPGQSVFALEYWVNTVGFWFRRPDPEGRDLIRHWFGCEKYSEDWWRVNASVADTLRRSRINVLFVRTLDLLLDGGSTVDADGVCHFYWELLDRWVDFYLERADCRWLAGFHLVVQTEGKEVYCLRRGADGGTELGTAALSDPEGERWFAQYLPALYAHIKERGWEERWLQHVQDEPAEPDSWRAAREAVRRYMPGIRCLDAIDNQEPMTALQGEMDLWIPRVDIYEEHRAFYDYRLALGDARWTYTCCLPTEMNYVNKFIGWPAIHTRVLFWGCFARHFTGFLHWGFNHWDPDDEWFGFGPNAYFKGDGYIVYPDRENLALRPSIRLLLTRDSAQDYELLRLLADRAPDRAYALAERVIRRFNDFDWDTGRFEEARRELLGL